MYRDILNPGVYFKLQLTALLTKACTDRMSRRIERLNRVRGCWKLLNFTSSLISRHMINRAWASWSRIRRDHHANTIARCQSELSKHVYTHIIYIALTEEPLSPWQHWCQRPWFRTRPLETRRPLRRIYIDRKLFGYEAAWIDPTTQWSHHPRVVSGPDPSTRDHILGVTREHEHWMAHICHHLF